MAVSEPNTLHFGGETRRGSLVSIAYTFLAIGGALLIVPTIVLLAGSDWGISVFGFGPLGLYFMVASLLTREVHSVELHASPREAHVLVENSVTRKKKMRQFPIPEDARVLFKEDNDGGVEVTIDALPGYVDFAHLKRYGAGRRSRVALPGLDDEDIQTLKEIAGKDQWKAFLLTREIAAFLDLKPEGELRMAVWKR